MREEFDRQTLNAKTTPKSLLESKSQTFSANVFFGINISVPEIDGGKMASKNLKMN